MSRKLLFGKWYYATNFYFIIFEWSDRNGLGQDLVNMQNIFGWRNRKKQEEKNFRWHLLTVLVSIYLMMPTFLVINCMPISKVLQCSRDGRTQRQLLISLVGFCRAPSCASKTRLFRSLTRKTGAVRPFRPSLRTNKTAALVKDWQKKSQLGLG